MSDTSGNQTLVPLHSVIVSRPHPNGRTDKEGNPVHQRLSPKLGEPFEFTPEEVEDLKASGHEFREPTNETTNLADQAANEAADSARVNRSAALDAANTARAGARGKAKPAPTVTGTATNRVAETEKGKVKPVSDDTADADEEEL